MKEKVIIDLLSLVVEAIRTNTQEEALDYLYGPAFEDIPNSVFNHIEHLLTV